MAALPVADVAAVEAVDSDAQVLWAAQPLRRRLQILRRARHLLAQESDALVSLFPPGLARSRADSYAAEILPLLDACRFLEREAEDLLRPRRLGSAGRPFWLGGVTALVERVPLGTVLVIGPFNYPLFLPGVQALQALAAGNAVVWKPGRGGEALALKVAETLLRAGLPAGVLRVSGDSAAAGVAALAAGPDKVVFTGSLEAGRAVLAQAAEKIIPVVAELSGCDACIVLPGANAERMVAALEFAMRFNGSATCMAPRRMLLVGTGHEALLILLRTRLAALAGVELPLATRRLLCSLLDEAAREGATVHGSAEAGLVKPILVEGTTAMRMARTEIMAPVLTVLRVADEAALLAAEQQSAFGLTASIFGEERAARALAARLCVGTVVINDVIVPTADPRVPFGGRRQSGYGVTRGAEGLLEMTAVKTTMLRRGGSTRHYEATDERHEQMFAGIVQLSHGGALAGRLRGVRGVLAAVRRLGSKAEKDGTQ